MIKQANHCFLPALIFFCMVFFTSCTSRDHSPGHITSTPLKNEPSLVDSLKGSVPGPDLPISDIVRRIFRDKKGHWWFGTNSDGVLRYDGHRLSGFSTAEGFAGIQVTGITEDRQGNIWFSTNAGVNLYNGRSFENFSKKDGLPSDWAWSVFEDSKGNIWAGTTEGVCRYDAEKKKFSPFPLPSPALKNNNSMISSKLAWCITEDKNGNIFFGTDGNGVCIYDGESFRHITTDQGLPDNCISCIVFDKQGNTWFSSMAGGVSCFDGRSFTYFNMKNGAIGDNEVWTLKEDSKGNTWFSSEGFGVYRYDARLNDSVKSLVHFAKKDGLEILAVQCMYEDPQGRIWLGGAGGVYRYDGKNFVNITTSGPWE